MSKRLTYDRAMNILSDIANYGGITKSEFYENYGMSPRKFRIKCESLGLPGIQYLSTSRKYKLLENDFEREMVSEHLGKVTSGLIKSFKKTAMPIIPTTHNPLIKKLSRLISR